jgi:hypothetical protein
MAPPKYDPEAGSAMSFYGHLSKVSLSPTVFSPEMADRLRRRPGRNFKRRATIICFFVPFCGYSPSAVSKW